MGWALRSVAGAAPPPPWPQTGQSFYDAVFEPQAAWQSPRAVPLWGLVCSDERTRLQPGDTLSGRLHLLGDWPSWATDVWEEAFRVAGATGLGEGRHRMELSSWSLEHLRPVPPPQLSPEHTLELHTLTPCRLQEAQRDLKELEPAAIARGLVRRLRAILIQTRDEDPFANGLGSWLFEQATTLKRLAGTSHLRPLERKSAHQGRKHPVPAVTGWVRMGCDDWNPWADLFNLAPWLHIGRQPNFGLGAVEVRWGCAG